MELLNSYRVTRAPSPMNSEPVHTEDATPDCLQEKIVEGRNCHFRKIFGHIVANNANLNYKSIGTAPMLQLGNHTATYGKNLFPNALQRLAENKTVLSDGPAM